MSIQVFSVPGQTEGKRKTFFKWKSMDLSYQISLTCGVNVNYYKSVDHSIPTCENRKHPDNFQNKSGSSAFIWGVQVYSLLGQTEGERKAFLGGSIKGGHIVILPPRVLGCYKRWKSLSCEIWNNPTPPLFLIRPPYK